ncbi:MAG TPA: hypothetical protein VFA15_03985, partial [Nitrososphaera sp.]|nr:hypothetical protein [Nitrososphaera sp.]
ERFLVHGRDLGHVPVADDAIEQVLDETDHDMTGIWGIKVWPSISMAVNGNTSYIIHYNVILSIDL